MSPSSDLPPKAEAPKETSLLASTHARTLRRQSGGARVNVSKRVVVYRGDDEIDGWALNMSRGGLRIIVEEVLASDIDIRIAIGDEGDDDYQVREAHIVWARNEPDGTIAGVEFNDDGGSAPPDDLPGAAPPPPASTPPVSSDPPSVPPPAPKE